MIVGFNGNASETLPSFNHPVYLTDHWLSINAACPIALGLFERSLDCAVVGDTILSVIVTLVDIYNFFSAMSLD